MQLSGALSNPQLLLEGSLGQLERLKKRLTEATLSPIATRRPSVRIGRISRAVSEVLRQADGPMHVNDIHRACEAHLGEPVSPSTVNDCLSEHSRGRHPRFARVARGTYALIETR